VRIPGNARFGEQGFCIDKNRPAPFLCKARLLDIPFGKVAEQRGTLTQSDTAAEVGKIT
jgi:hypothetical protein